MKFTHNNFLMSDDPGAAGGGGTLLSNANSADPPPQNNDPTPSSEHKGFATHLDGENFREGWTENLPENLKGSAGMFQNFKNPNDLLDSFANAQTLLGKQSSAITPINENSTPEEVAKYRSKMDIPETPEAYGFQKPEGLNQNVEWDQEGADWFAKIAHENNIPKNSAEKLLSAYNERIAGKSQGIAESQEQLQEEFALQQEGMLQEEYGLKLGEKIQVAKRAAFTAGMTQEDMSDPIFNNAKVIKMLANLGDSMGEHQLIEGKTIGINSPSEMAKDIMTNPDNPKYKLYMSGDSTVDREVNNLLKSAQNM